MITEPNLPFGDLLRRYRVAAGLTQEELAELANLSVRGISDLERGVKQAPHRYTIQALVEALALPEEEQAALQATIARRRGPASTSSDASQMLTLPLAPTPFIGRRQEVKEIGDTLRRETVRLLTLTGPGGIGKTRLALHVASELPDAFPDGVIFVSLDSVADPGLVPSTIATRLELKEVSGEPILAKVIEYLNERRMLLVLDSFEHLLEAAQVVSRLLALCPYVTILITSRAVLHVAAEHEYPVPPLPTPAPGYLPDLDLLGRYDAVQLFLQRAQAVKPDFTMTAESTASIAEICWRLDGLPLAIELAAARIRLFHPQALAGRLKTRLGLLTGGAKDVPCRQQTLRNTFDWSYDLLSPQEQALFAGLSVFVGSFTFEGAAAVCNSEGMLDLLDGIASLVDKSLLLQKGGAEPRFGMLETIREYASEKLETQGNTEATRTAHAEWFLALVEEAEPELRGPDQRLWLRRLERDHDNLLAALQWTEENSETTIGLRLATALWRFWSTRGQYSEGRRWLEVLLAFDERLGHPVPPMLRAKALNQAARFADRQGDLERVATLANESLALYRAAEDKVGLAAALSTLGGTMKEQGDYKEAMAILDESLALRRELGDTARIASALNSVGGAARWQGQYDRAESCFNEALQLYTERGDTAGIGHMLFRLGDVALDRCDFLGARRLYQESLVLRGDL
ncbi:MAG TPA: tetratricopeptide repeat protein, partial [Chloroflexota bacterium]